MGSICLNVDRQLKLDMFLNYQQRVGLLNLTKDKIDLHPMPGMRHVKFLFAECNLSSKGFLKICFFSAGRNKRTTLTKGVSPILDISRKE